VRKRGAQDFSHPQWDAKSIRALRDHLGYTQQQFADEPGIRQQTISEWETEQHRPRGATVTLLDIVAKRAGFVFDDDTGNEGIV